MAKISSQEVEDDYQRVVVLKPSNPPPKRPLRRSVVDATRYRCDQLIDDLGRVSEKRQSAVKISRRVSATYREEGSQQRVVSGKNGPNTAFG